MSAEKIKLLIPDRALRAKFNAASTFREINILLYLPEVVKMKFRNIPNAYITGKVAEDIKRLHGMKDEPLAPTAVITRHPLLWKWAHSVFRNWEAAIAYAADKYPEAKINYQEILASYQIKRKEILEEIIGHIKTGKLTSTSTRDWILRNIRTTYDRACIYHGDWNEIFHIAQAEFSKRQHAIFYPPPKITKDPNFLP